MSLMPRASAWPCSSTWPPTAACSKAEEELAALRAFDEAKAADDEAIPFDQAVAEIERRR
jgi:hypothetical protein